MPCAYQVGILWGPTGRHTFVKMPRLPGRPASCPPAQHSMAPGQCGQCRGGAVYKPRNKAQDNRPLAGSGESRACVEASASRDRVGTISHSSSEMRGGWPRAGELGNGNDRGGPGRPEAPAPQRPLSPCPPSHSSESTGLQARLHHSVTVQPSASALAASVSSSV